MVLPLRLGPWSAHLLALISLYLPRMPTLGVPTGLQVCTPPKRANSMRSRMDLTCLLADSALECYLRPHSPHPDLSALFYTDQEIMGDCSG